MNDHIERLLEDLMEAQADWAEAFALDNRGLLPGNGQQRGGKLGSLARRCSRAHNAFVAALSAAIIQGSGMDSGVRETGRQEAASVVQDRRRLSASLPVNACA